MKIELLRTNHDCSPSDHPSSEAWENSRPNNKPLELDKILSLDLPVNEVPMATLFIESTILEREIITTMRNHVMWAQTSRVQNILEFTYPEEVYEHLYAYEASRQAMVEADKRGIRQDEYRKCLPVMSSTKYTVNLSMRDMIHLAKYFIDLSEINPHLEKLFNSSFVAFYHILEDNFGIKPKHLASYKQREILHPIATPSSGLVGDTLVINTTLSLSLRAQLVRHRALHIQDNLLELMSDKSIMIDSIDREVEVQISGLVSDWTEIIRKRSCWIAQYDLWKDLLDKAESFLNLGTNSLPCHSGSCPYDGDAQARYTDEDPNAVCPIHAKLNNKNVTASQYSDIINQYHEDKRPRFWEQEINLMAIE